MSFHMRIHLTSSSKGRQHCNSERKESGQQQNNPFSAHIPKWRLSRLQNLAISPLATILLLEKQPRSEQDWGVTGHPESHTGSRSGTAEIAYSQLWRGRCDHTSQSLLRSWQRARCAAPPRLAAPDISGCQGGNAKLRQTCTCQTHTHWQVYQVQSTTLRESGRNAFAAFPYIPKAWVTFSESF